MDARALFVAATLLTGNALAEGEPEVTQKNWRTHPRIEAVRAIYTQNEKLEREHKLKAKRLEFSCDGPGMETERVALRDEAGRIRQYLTGLGGEAEPGCERSTPAATGEGQQLPQRANKKDRGT